jgi:hypothetical protein
MFFLLSLMFSLQQNREQEGKTGSAVGGGIMYTHASKCKNDKIFKKELICKSILNWHHRLPYSW